MHKLIRWIEKIHYYLYSRLGLEYTPQRHWHLNDGVRVENKSFRVKQHVVSRSNCLYQLFPLQEIPLSSRADALNLKIQQWSPWSEVDCWVVWDKQGAMTWIWDKSQFALKSGYVVPETLLQAPAVDGCYRVPCSEGVEVQLWINNVLSDSFWKEKGFSEYEQQQWLALTGSTYTQGCQTPESMGYLPVPWANNESSRQVNKAGWVKGTVLAVLILIAFISAALVTEWYQWDLLEKKLEARHANLLVALQPVLTQRNRYQKVLSKVRALDALTPRQWQASLFTDVLNALEEAKCEPCSLVEWQFSGLQLDLIIKAERLSEKKLITALSNTGKFSHVNLTPIKHRQQMKISLVL